jgi:hypothetical protein
MAIIMSFGQRIENTVLGSLNKIDDMITRHKQWNDESVALGLIEDSEKLRVLKAELYRLVRLDNPNQQKILNLTSAIEHLEEIKQAEFNRKLETQKLNLTLPAQINQSLNAFLVFGLLAVIGSYAIAPICGNSRSQFCINARVIPIQIEQFFKN